MDGTACQYEFPASFATEQTFPADPGSKRLRAASEDDLNRIGLVLLALLPTFAVLPASGQDTATPIYSESLPTSSGLPFDPATDFRESFVAPNGQSVQVLVKGPEGSGTYTRAMRSGEIADNYFPAVVAEAVHAGVHHLVIPKGVYLFHGPELCTNFKSASCNLPTSCNANQYYNCQPHWVIGKYPQNQAIVPNSITDLDIDFSGSELDFSAPIIGIWVLEAQRIRLRNFTMDWPSLPIASVGTIVADPRNPGHNQLVLDGQYPAEDQYWGGPVQIQAVDPWDEGTFPNDPPGTFDPRSNNNDEVYFIFGSAPQPTYVGRTATGGQALSCESCHFRNSATDPTCSFFSGCANFDGFPEGSRVLVRHYTYNGIALLINWSNDIDIENLTLRTGPGNGIMITNNGGYRGFRLANSAITRGPGRLISVASGSVDLGLQGDVLIENNGFGYQGDDGFSIHSDASPVISANGAQVVVPAVCSPDPMDEPVTGDQLAFFDAGFRWNATARVKAATGTECAPSLNLTLDHAIAGLDGTGNFLDLTQMPSARYFVHDNDFHENRGHGIIVNAPYGSIDHNHFFDNSMGAIVMPGGAGVGPGATNLAITNNVISYPGQSAQQGGAVTALAQEPDGNIELAPVFEKIQMTGNVIASSPGPALVATSLHQFLIRQNTFDNINRNPGSPGYYGPIPSTDSIVLYGASDGTVCGNAMEGPSVGPVGDFPTGYRVLIQPDCLAATNH
jgi:hypothetical protein